jgi:hypothetical protein
LIKLFQKFAEYEAEPHFNAKVRLWRFSAGKRRCLDAEAESSFAEGKYFSFCFNASK